MTAIRLPSPRTAWSRFSSLATSRVLPAAPCKFHQKPMASASTPLDSGISVSAGYDEGKVKQAAAHLTLSDSKGARRWHVTSDGKGLERVIRFKTFKATWDFMNSVAGACKEAKHHPEWTNIYNKTHIIWTTHSPPGLSTKDTSLATFCDEAATKHGELEPTPEQQKDDEILFRSKKMEAPDCCTLKT